ncbi:hypothetical protein O185_12825 [Photorhabdus temperata J3]|uniref:Uncharacterized protein n=1 Tax=Photorhabdus temperata J3 TaxID=1389415 RepID=U7QXC0_PHOTE|nr:hypothetical protein O185_12825 [Photorhabdus temperata J3]
MFFMIYLFVIFENLCNCSFISIKLDERFGILFIQIAVISLSIDMPVQLINSRL